MPGALSAEALQSAERKHVLRVLSFRGLRMFHVIGTMGWTGGAVLARCRLGMALGRLSGIAPVPVHDSLVTTGPPLTTRTTNDHTSHSRTPAGYLHDGLSTLAIAGSGTRDQRARWPRAANAPPATTAITHS